MQRIVVEMGTGYYPSAISLVNQPEAHSKTYPICEVTLLRATGQSYGEERD